MLVCKRTDVGREVEMTDARSSKTVRNIADAFWRLLREQPLDQIRTTRIIQLSGVNRSTFYAYYSSKYDLASDLGDELLHDLIITSESKPVTIMADDQASDGLRQHVSGMLECLKKQGEHLTLLLGVGGDPSFRSRLDESIRSVWATMQVSAHLRVPERFALAAASGMVSELISEWVKTGFQPGPAEATDTFTRMVRGLLSSLME